jgi:hypothetical protein
MSERNENMAAMLAAGVPGRDLAFEIAVLARIERRRFHRDIARNLVAALAAAVLLALVAPQLAVIPALAAGWSGGFPALTGNTPLLMGSLLFAASAVWYFRPAQS